jgi:hypothetical protein
MKSPVDLPSRPDGLRLERKSSGLLVTISWRNMTSWALLPLGLIAAAIPVLLSFKLAGMPWNDPIRLLMLVNVTRLEVTPERITIKHGPLPWRRGSEVATNTIRRLEVRQFRSGSEGRVATHYHLWAVHEDGRETCLLERDTTADQANFAHAEIQQVLGGGAAEQPPRKAK